MAEKQQRQNVAAVARQRPARFEAQDMLYRDYDYIIKPPEPDGIPPRVGDAPGVNDCELYTIDDQGNLQAQYSALLDGTAVAPVYNLSTQQLAGGTYYVADQVGNNIVIRTTTDDVETTPWLRYRILRQHSPGTENGHWFAKIMIASAGAVYNPADPATPLKVGDEVEIWDPHNLFPGPSLEESNPDNHPGSTGTAYLRSPITSNDVPEDVVRWEVESTTLPVARMRVFIEQCLLFDTDSLVAKFEADALTKQSDTPNVDFPPEATPAGSGTYPYQLTVYNPLKLQAVDDSWVWVERDNECAFSNDSEEFFEGGGFPGKWNITHVEQPIARWMVVIYQSGSWLPTSTVWEGWAPDSCPPTVTPVYSACLQSGTQAIACYKPEGHEYVPISTMSAMLGAPSTVTMPTGPMIAKDDGGEPYECGGTGICFDQKTTDILVFTSDCDEAGNPTLPPTGATENALCIPEQAICEILCCCEMFEYSDECSPCAGTCEFEWTVTQSEPTLEGIWTLLDGSECESNPNCQCIEPTWQGPFSGYTISIPCNEPPPPPECPCGDVTYTFTGGAWVLTDYNCTQGCEAPEPPPITGGETDGDVETICCDDSCLCGVCNWVWSVANQKWESGTADTCTQVDGDQCGCFDYPTDPGTEDGQTEQTCCRTDTCVCGGQWWEWDGAAWSTVGAATCTGTCVPGPAPTADGLWVGYRKYVCCVFPNTCNCACTVGGANCCMEDITNFTITLKNSSGGGDAPFSPRFPGQSPWSLGAGCSVNIEAQDDGTLGEITNFQFSWLPGSNSWEVTGEADGVNLNANFVATGCDSSSYDDAQWAIEITSTCNPVAATMTGTLSAALRAEESGFFGKGCGCRGGDVAALMDRWGPEKSLQNVDQLTKIITSKKSVRYSPKYVRQVLVAVIEKYRDAQGT